MIKPDGRHLSIEIQNYLRQRAIGLRKAGKPVAQIAEYLGVHVSTVSKWWGQYQEQGSAALVQQARGRQLGEGQQLSDAQQEQLQALMLSGYPEDYGIESALWTRRAVKALIEAQCDIKMPIRTVGDYLKRWDYSPQKPLKQAYEQDPDAVATWLDEVYPAIEARAKAEGAQIHWEDESGVRSNDQRGRSYSPKGQTPIAPHSARQRQRVNYIASVSKNGMVRFMLYTGSFDGPLYLRFLERLIQSAQRKLFVIVDQHPVHTRRLVQDWLAAHQSQIEVFYLPSYSPQLNPVEYLNNDVKQQVHDQPPTMSLEQLKQSTASVLMSLQKLPHRVSNYFRHPDLAYAA
ncbi:MAG: IS630 family transposase [Cyanobacteria bacterium P01_A01_bin.17]